MKRNLSFVSPLLLVLFLICSQPAVSLMFASQQEPKQDEPIKLEATLVNVYVRVTDGDGRAVSGLRREDFHLFEDGVEQQIEHFNSHEDSVTIALAVSVTGLMAPRLKEVRETVAGFVDLLRPGDRAMLITFDPYEHILAEATGDKEKLKKAINKIGAQGSVNLFQGIYPLVHGRLQPFPGRKAVLFFTDGVDHRSAYGTYEDTVLGAERGNALIYPIQYDSAYRNDPKLAKDAIKQHKLAVADTYLHELAQKSGGRLFRVEEAQPLKPGFDSVARELQQQYGLGYYSKKRLEPYERRAIGIRLRQPNMVAISRSFYAPDQATGNSGRQNNPSLESASGVFTREEKKRWQDIPAEYFGYRQGDEGINMSGPYTLSFFSGDIGVRLANVILQNTKEGDVISALIHIDPSRLTFTEEADGWQSAAANVFAASYEGTIPDGAVATMVKIRERGGQLAEVMRNGKSVNLNIPLPRLPFPSMHQVRVIVRDSKSERGSYASQFVSVPSRDTFLYMSGVVLSAEPSLTVEKLMTSFDGLYSENTKASPAARSFRRGTQLNYSYYVYNAYPYSVQGRKQLVEDVQIERKGERPILGPFDEMDVTDQKDKNRLLVKGSLPLGPKMSTGWYVLRITLSNERPKGSEYNPKAVQWIDFQVIE